MQKGEVVMNHNSYDENKSGLISRRDFIKKAAFSTALLAGSAILPGASLFAETGKGHPDLVAVRNGMPDKMFETGIAALGGMKRFVKPNQTVVIKPNIGWDVVPELGANTNPALIKAIVKECYLAGAKKVYVFDNSCDYGQKAYSTSGIEKAAKDENAMVVPGWLERHYQEVRIPGAAVLKNAKVHELILDSDVFINVPVLKHHSMGKLTIALKNLMGVVWDRGFYHRNNLHRCISEFPLYRKPDLNIIDAYLIMTKNGPRGISKNDLELKKMQIISPDIVAADAAAAKVFGLDPERIPYLRMAADLKLGTINLDQLKISRLTV